LTHSIIGQPHPLFSSTGIFRTRDELEPSSMFDGELDKTDQVAETIGAKVGQPASVVKEVLAEFSRQRVCCERERDFTPEVSLKDASRILSLNRRTVLKLIDEGILEWRNNAPRSSSIPRYFITLDSIKEFRNSHRATSPEGDRTPRISRRRAARSPYPGRQLKHITLCR
jgi:hypothetical protein